MAISLETLVKNAMVNAVNTALTTYACIQFYNTNTTAVLATPTANRMLTSTGLKCYTTAGAMAAATGGSALFSAITSNTVQTSGTVLAYAIFKTTSASPTTQDVAWVGSIATDTADMTFNTTVWAIGDNIAISSLTFQQP
jgi:hypothetical protein